MNSQQPIFQERLKAIYKSQDKIVQLIEGLDEIPEQSLKDYYVKLQMIVKDDDNNGNDTGYESISGEKKEIELADLFRETSDDKSSKIPKKLLILGGAGVGKSTMMQYIAFKWSSNELWQNKFDHIYRVSLKTLLNPDWKCSPWAYEPEELNDSLLKCLVHYTLTLNLDFKNRKNIKTTMLPWDVTDRKKILLLLDGYDEVAHLQNQSDFKIVMEEIFEFENIILTSRPNAVKNEMRMNFDRIIESTGLDQKGIEQYFDRYFPKEHDNKKQELCKFLDARTIIREICKIPVNIAMLCYIWLYSESNERLKEISNISTLYQEMFDHLGLRYLQKKFEATNPSKNYELGERSLGKFDLDEIRVLTHVAYKAMTGGGVATNENDEVKTETLIIKGAYQAKGKLDLHDKNGISLKSSINYLSEISQIKSSVQDKVTIKQLYKYGLLKIEGGATVSTKDSSDTDLQKLSFSFIHLTFQEFCTACYLKGRLQKGDDQERNEICRFLSEHRNEPRYAMTLKFMAGIITDDQSKENDIVLKLFWDAMICNVDGILELGIEAKTSLILGLLGEAVIKKDGVTEIDSRIPNKEQIMDLIDAIVLKDIRPFHKQLQETSYMSENIKEGVLRALLAGTQVDNASIMKDILTRSEAAVKNAIENMLEQKLVQAQALDRYQQKALIDCLIDLTVNFVGKIDEGNQSKEDYKVRVMQGLSRVIQRLAEDPSDNIHLIENAIRGMNKIILEIEVFDQKYEFKELLDKVLRGPIYEHLPLKKEAYVFFCQAFSKIHDQEYAFLCMLKLSRSGFWSKDLKKLTGYDIIEQEKRKDYVIRLAERVYEPYTEAKEMVEMMFQNIGADLAIERLAKVEVLLTSKDVNVQKSAVTVMSRLITNLPHENVRFTYFRKIMGTFYNCKDKDLVEYHKKSIKLWIEDINCFENYNIVMEYLKEILNLTPNKAAITLVAESLLNMTCDHDIFLEIKLSKEFKSCLQADQSEEEEEITNEKTKEENFGEAQLCSWRLKVFELLKNAIDTRVATSKQYENSSKNLASSAESSSSQFLFKTEILFTQSYEEAKSLLTHGKDSFREQGIISLKELVLGSVKNNQEKLEAINKVLGDLLPLIRDQSSSVMQQALVAFLELFELSQNIELGCQFIQNLINFFKENEVYEMKIQVEVLYEMIGPLSSKELNVKSLDLILTSYQEETDQEMIDIVMKCSSNIFTELKVEIQDSGFASQILRRWLDILKKCDCENLIQKNVKFITGLCYFAKDHQLASHVCGKLLSFLENNDKTTEDSVINEMSDALILSCYAENELATMLAEKFVNNFLDKPKNFVAFADKLVHFLKYSKNEELTAKVWDILVDLGVPVDPSNVNTAIMPVVINISKEINDPKRQNAILEKFMSYLEFDNLPTCVRLHALEFLILEVTIFSIEDKKRFLANIHRSIKVFLEIPNELSEEAFKGLVNLAWDAVQMPDLTELAENIFMWIVAWRSLLHKFSDSTLSVLTQKIAKLITSRRALGQFLQIENQRFKKYLADNLAESFKKFTEKLNYIRILLRDKKLDVEVIEKNLFDGKIKNDLKEQIQLQVEIFKQTSTEECFNNLRSSIFKELNFIGKEKGYKLIEVALRMTGNNFSTEESSQKKLVDSAQDILNLQVEYINSELLKWLNDNLEKILKISRESLPFIKKIYHRLLKDFEITSLEEELIIKLVNLGFTTSITRKREVIFEGKTYNVKGKNIELLLERVAGALLDQQKDALSIQYRDHEPIFRKSVKIGIREASADIKKVFSLIDKPFQLTNQKWLFTRLSAQKGQEISIIEQRNLLGDHVIYDLERLKFIKINPLEIDKQYEGLFGNYNPVSPLQYLGQSKELDRDIGYQIIGAGPNWKSEFENVLNSELGVEKIYLQQELLNKGNDQRNALLVSELEKKLEDNQTSLQRELDQNIFLNQDQKKKLIEYYKAFLSTFTEVYTTAQVIESGQVVVDAGSSSKTGLASTLATFIPVIGSNLSNAIDTIDKLLRSEEMMNSARRMKLLASSPVELEQLVGKSARAILQDKTKQNLIIKAAEEKEDESDFSEESLKDILADKLKKEVMKLVGTKPFGEMYPTAAEKMGNNDAKELIHQWINKQINEVGSSEGPQGGLKQQFVNAIIHKDRPNNSITSSEDSSSCLNPCKGGCQLF